MIEAEEVVASALLRGVAQASDEVRIVFRVNPYRGGAAPPPVTETPFQILRVSNPACPLILSISRFPFVWS